jgi:23S rRNA pseudouridine2604 synthase
MQENEEVWLNKFISESGICSRRDADKLIEQGLVTINKEIAQKGDQVFAGDKVRVNGKLIRPRRDDDLIFIALNKPVGIVSTTESVKDNIVKFVNHPSRIFPIGRLDKDSQGLIFLTNNGNVVNKILRAGNNHEKEYIVTVDKPLTDAVIAGLGNGVPIMGTVTKKCKVVKEGVKSFRITLVQGLNRQIRRMCEYFEYDVLKLERIRIMNITLKGIPLGEWRDLTEDEIDDIDLLTQESSSEFIPSANTKIKPTFGHTIPKKKYQEMENIPKAKEEKKPSKSDFRKPDFKKTEFKKPSDKKPLFVKITAASEEDGSEKPVYSKPYKPSGVKSTKPPSGKRIGKSKPKNAPKSGKPTLNRSAKPKTNAGRPGSGQRTKKGGY